MKLRMTEILKGLNKRIPGHRLVLDSFKNTIPFVLSDGDSKTTSRQPRDPSKFVDTSNVYDDIKNIKIAPPFPVTSYEYESFDIDHHAIYGDQHREVHTLHCIELSPECFIFTLISDIVDSVSRNTVVEVFTDTNPVEYHNCKVLLRRLLNLINNKKHGVVKQKRAYKFNKGKGDKRSFKQSEFVYINHSKSEQRERICGKKIEYRHGFYVSAHWRKTRKPESLGLNREGERCVKGLTWVGHYFKGDDPIIKTRKVK